MTSQKTAAEETTLNNKQNLTQRTGNWGLSHNQNGKESKESQMVHQVINMINQNMSFSCV